MFLLKTQSGSGMITEFHFTVIVVLAVAKIS